MRHLLISALILVSLTATAQQGTNLRSLQRSDTHGQTVATVDTVIFGTDTTYALKFVETDQGGIDSIAIICNYIVYWYADDDRNTVSVSPSAPDGSCFFNGSITAGGGHPLNDKMYDLGATYFGDTSALLQWTTYEFNQFFPSVQGFPFDPNHLNERDTLYLSDGTLVVNKDTLPDIAGPQGPAGPPGADGAQGPAGPANWDSIPNVPASLYADTIPDNEGKLYVTTVAGGGRINSKTVGSSPITLVGGGNVDVTGIAAIDGGGFVISYVDGDSDPTNELDSKFDPSGVGVSLKTMYRGLSINKTNTFYALEVRPNPGYSPGSGIVSMGDGTNGMFIKESTSSNPHSVEVFGPLKLSNGSQGNAGLLLGNNDRGTDGQVFTSRGLGAAEWSTPSYFSGDYDDLINKPVVSNYWTLNGSNSDLSSISRTGRVGIGFVPTSSSSPLEIASLGTGASIRIRGDESVSRRGFIRFFDEDDSDAYDVGFIHAVNDYFQIRANGNTSIMVNNNGQVGIGGFADSDFDLFINDDFGLQIGKRFYFGNTLTQTNIYAPSGGSWAVENGAVDLVRIDRRGSGSGAGSLMRVGQWSTTTSADGFPGYGFFEESGLGMYRHNANELGLTTDGVGRLICSDEGVRIPLLDTDLSPPATTGTTKMVITDNTGQLSFKDEPTSSTLTEEQVEDFAFNASNLLTSDGLKYIDIDGLQQIDINSLAEETTIDGSENIILETTAGGLRKATVQDILAYQPSYAKATITFDSNIPTGITDLQFSAGTTIVKNITVSSSNNTFTPDYDGIYSIAVTLAIERNEGGFFNLDVMEEVSAGADIILDQISKRTDGGTVSTETYNFMLNLEAGTDYYLRVNSHSSTQAVTGIMSNGEVMINKIN